MTVALTNEEFEEIWGIFEHLMSPTAGNEELAQAIAGENRVWEILQGVRARTAVSDEQPPSLSEYPIS